MIKPSHKIAIIATIAKGIMLGQRNYEEKNLVSDPISDNELVNFSVDFAAEFYEKNKPEIENQGIYFFALSQE